MSSRRRAVVVRNVGRGDPANHEAVEQYLDSTRSMSPALFKATPNRWRAVDLSEAESGA